MKRIFILTMLIFSTLSISAQKLQTPDEFLGYKLGTKFSFHHRIIDYVRYVAAQNTSQVKIIDYGKTNEGRPLLVTVIASPENLAKIEEIRTNNLKSIGLLEGNPTAKVPAIAWLSYNVHGNEAVSSEAVMQVLYELLNKNNLKTQEFLKNTVVILDPCINPDGRDRYAQWYNRVANQLQPDANLFALEHNEPWPGGRFNHYMFDLNRDWAWQTQVETQQRMALYNQWMPHLHADFHEMGMNDPYYMPPSARPFHENITPYQRDFQNYLGEINKKNFDKNYWLYYTKENYDLLYPSYGDSYPTYNGAIGMTYEQGGGGRGGVAIMRDRFGDTLTLTQRIAHHFSTSMGSLEAISSRAEKTVDEFVKFFDAKNPVGVYKTYVLKTKGDEGKIKALTTLLDRLQIQYNFVNKGTLAMGYNYLSQKDENVQVENNDLIISALQPKSVFTKILFEPHTVVEDSLTYDITAWALPYAYNLKGYAFKDKISVTTTSKFDSPISNVIPSASKPYAYLARWKSFEDVKFLSSILAKKIKVRVGEKAFEIENNKFDAGTLIITRTGNELMGDSFDKIIQENALSLNIQLFPVSSGLVMSGYDFGSDFVYPLKSPRVAVMSGEGISPTALGEVWHFFEQQIKYPISVIGTDYFNRVDLSKIDVLILPDGNYDKAISTIDNLKKWVQIGGKIIALESASNFFADKDGFLLKHKKEADKPDETKMPYKDIKSYESRQREGISEQVLGGIYKVELDKSHPLAFGYDGSYIALVRDAYNFDFMKNAWNVGVIKDSNQLGGFTGKTATEKMKNSLILGVQDLGQGKIIYMGDDPLFRSFWYGGKLLFGNAVFLVN